MKEFSYAIKSEGFEGSVKISAPSFPQRMRYVADCNFEFNGEKGSISLNTKNAEAIAKMVEYAKSHVKEIDVTHIESEQRATNFDDLSYNNTFDSVLIEVSSVIMSGGGNLGERKGQK